MRQFCVGDEKLAWKNKASTRQFKHPQAHANI
jgi:hypothetical protein